MTSGNNQKRHRLIALSFAAVLLLLVYGPLANWFAAADRLLYDALAGRVPEQRVDAAVIISIDPERMNDSELLAVYGQVVGKVRNNNPERIVMTQPPDIAASDELPGWVGALASGPLSFAPTRHRLAEVTARHGFVDVAADNDGVLRRAALWKLHDGIQSPSLPLAIMLSNDGAPITHHLSATENAVFLSRYAEVERLEISELMAPRFASTRLRGKTVFIDHQPPLIAASARLPSGQFVTPSEMVAAQLADIEAGTAIVAPTWVSALEWLIPALLAIVAVLFMPDRSRRDIVSLTVTTVALLVLLEILSLFLLHVRLDLGRPILIFIGIALLSIWLVGDPRQATRNAFKRGADFLAAGRLEPAFAEFRQCSPSDTLATMMYKLSLAFEEQSKPERAEAVLEWMKRTHGDEPPAQAGKKPATGVPQRLGRYVIEKRIGRGAMGAVYLGKDPRINRAVAVKAIPIEQEFEDEELKEARMRFFREAESAGRLTHPNIITVYDAGEDKGLAYIAMEFVPGISLRQFTDPKKLLAPKRAIELAAMTAEGLDYAHNQGVIHRDIKPANLLYNPREGTLKISDFGVARMTDNNRTKTGIVLGTPMYMSPEQLGAESLTGLSDLFSLGVTLYELLVGEVPFKANNIALLMTKITTEEAAPVSKRRAGIPPAIDAILAKALAKRPEDRFSCGAEMAISLRNCTRTS